MGCWGLNLHLLPLLDYFFITKPIEVTAYEERIKTLRFFSNTSKQETQRKSGAVWNTRNDGICQHLSSQNWIDALICIVVLWWVFGKSAIHMLSFASRWGVRMERQFGRVLPQLSTKNLASGRSGALIYRLACIENTLLLTTTVNSVDQRLRHQSGEELSLS